MIRDQLLAQLREDEGTGPMKMGRYLPYFDCCGKFFRLCRCAEQGKLTVGYGWNIEDNGLPQVPTDWLLEFAVAEASSNLQRKYPWLADLDGARYVVLVQMMFNMGASRLAGFRKMWAALKAKDYDTASAEMLDSEWRIQVKGRADRLARQLRLGTWQD